MVYAICKDGKQINVIEADAVFVETYCKENGFSYMIQKREPEPAPEPAPTEMEQLRADIDYIAMETGVVL